MYIIYAQFKVYIRQSNTCISCEHILYFFPNRLSWLGQEEVTFSTNYNDHKRSSSSGSVKTNIYMLQENKLLGYPLLIPHALLNYCQLLKPLALLLIRVNIQTPSNEHLVISDIYKVIDVDVSHRTMTFILKIFIYPSLCLCLVFFDTELFRHCCRWWKIAACEPHLTFVHFSSHITLEKIHIL